jgi:hypothetical protein
MHGTERKPYVNELVNAVCQKTGLPQDQATAAAQAVVDFLKSKLPGPIASQLDGVLGGQGAGGIAGQAQQALGGLGGGLGGMMGGGQGGQQGNQGN